MTTRRGALRLLGMAPLAAKKASMELAKKLAGDATISQLAGLSLVPHGSQDNCHPSGGPNDWKKKLKAWFALKQPIPEWHEEQIRRQCSWVPALDADLAAKKSWSMSVKIITQRERNVQRVMRDMQRNLWLDDQREEFHKKTGIWF